MRVRRFTCGTSTARNWWVPSPAEKPDLSATHHRDGTVTFWHYRLNQWLRESAYQLMFDDEAMGYLSDADRERVESRGSR